MSKLVRGRARERYPNDSYYEVNGELLIDRLKDKVVEEALEIRFSDSPENFLEEIADLWQALCDLEEATDINFIELNDIMFNKARTKGTFIDGLVWDAEPVAWENISFPVHSKI